jgi:hypothetical protein
MWKNNFCASFKSLKKGVRAGSICKSYVSGDPHKNVTNSHTWGEGGGQVRYLRAGTAEDVIHALGPGLGEEEGLQVAGGGTVVRRLHRVVVLSNTRPPS